MHSFTSASRTAPVAAGTFKYDISNNGTLADPFTGKRAGRRDPRDQGQRNGNVQRPDRQPRDREYGGCEFSSQAFGIILGARGGGGSHTTRIRRNTVREFFDRGIVLEAGEGSPALTATVDSTVSDFRRCHKFAARDPFRFRYSGRRQRADHHRCPRQSDRQRGRRAAGRRGLPDAHGQLQRCFHRRLRRRQLERERAGVHRWPQPRWDEFRRDAGSLRHLQQRTRRAAACARSAHASTRAVARDSG